MNAIPEPVGAGAPELTLLGNGRYSVAIGRLGGGFSRWQANAVTRWRDDATRDAWGSFCYVRDADDGQLWATTFQPTRRAPEAVAAAFEPGKATLGHRDGTIAMRTEIAVAADADVELRRVTLSNDGDEARRLTLTSYAEIVLGSAAADADHPAFEKLFVQTEVDAATGVLLCTRRPRAPGEPRPWMFHALVAAPGTLGPLSHETDRARFLGRGRTTERPRALDDDAPLSGTQGAVLDPVAAIRASLALAAGGSATVTLLTGAAASRDECLAMARRFADAAAIDAAFEQATARARDELASQSITVDEATLFTRLAANLLYSNASLRAPADVLARNRLGQPGLWPHAISGDLPIALLLASDAAQLATARALVKAHAFWQRHGVDADLVVVHADVPALKDALAALVAASPPADGAKGEVFLLAAGQVDDASGVLLRTVARFVVDDRDGALAEQVSRRAGSLATPRASSRPFAPADPLPARTPDALQFDNGTGGFTPDGREYVVDITRDRMTPTPWLNVLANPGFGTIVSESGGANTWRENAQLFRLTPWSNDPVGDASTEAWYVRDEDAGRTWSATLLPCPGAAPYRTRHGFGYSVFEHVEDGIASTLTMHVDVAAPVKFVRLALRNDSARTRRLSVTGYVEWVLGGQVETSRPFVATAVDAETGALFASNSYDTDFEGRVAFLDADPQPGLTRTGSRAAFLGAGGSVADPAGLDGAALDGVVGAGLDPCGAIRVPFELAPGESRTIVFRLGAGATADDARALVRRWRGDAAAESSLAAVTDHWKTTLGAIQVRTPDPALDLLANGWLVYQVLACRVLARTAFYQASGAFGFRDQLQDVMALVHADPARVRAHLLLAASRQFVEGDAQHWWHPPSGKGIRTRVSDDYLWLPLVACRYVQVTGDRAVLDEAVPFVQGRALKDGEDSNYDAAPPTDETATLYEHARRAVLHGLRFGAHGLPLMGTGDWNDGMNLVGAKGQGESVWLAFFLARVLADFGALAASRGDAELAERCRAERERLSAAIDEHAWDGGWYRRAWFDDGSPLGTSANTECRIDSIAQSWAVLSGAASPERAKTAMAALDEHLVRRDDRLIELLTPAFDQSDPSPGYIQGYVQGVRENGGQYTHAAVWAAMAFAAQGDAPRAWALFDILSPIRHALTPADVARYKTEPYVVASDVYSTTGHVGRGGWTWYTGAAGWLYRCVTESLLGLRVADGRLRVEPCLPADWPGFEMRLKRGRTTFDIRVTRAVPGSVATPASADGIALVDDGGTHGVEVVLP